MIETFILSDQDFSLLLSTVRFLKVMVKWKLKLEMLLVLISTMLLTNSFSNNMAKTWKEEKATGS
jgi:hypothetical protein